MKKVDASPLDPNTKKVLKIVFLTLFLDLIGFSIIFPLFPALAKHYLEIDQSNFFLKAIFTTINSFTHVTGHNLSSFNNIVLFGGTLGALYSFLQFVAAPFWGSLSDKIGRRPVLLVSIFGIFISYLIWIFSGNFTLLIISRIIGGIMGGNISTATAIVADVTNKENRSKGMAFVGIAFASGFLIGPAVGGILSTIDLTEIYPSLVSYGINPFSTPAIFASILALVNLYYVYKSYKETLPKNRNISKSKRSINPITLFMANPFEGVRQTNISYFFFLFIFSGMEFTLTFLAAERLNYTSMDNAYMFIFIGLILGGVQGGYVRKKARAVGERKMALQGLFAIIPGLIIVSIASSSLILYFGLFFLALGSSLIIPTLTALVSLYAPENDQGSIIGIFRSLGALARVMGPLFAATIYWRFGSSMPYIIGSILLIIPILLVKKLPKPSIN